MTYDACYKIIEDVPVTYSDAMKCSDSHKWQKAMDAEISALAENDTWNLTPLPEGRSSVGGKWVYTIKPGQNENDVKHKARFVAKGYSQRADIDYGETFSPTAHITSIRMLQQFSAQENITIHQMDVKSAYLNAPIDCEIFVEQPVGYETFGENGQKLFCKLNKSL